MEFLDVVKKIASFDVVEVDNRLGSGNRSFLKAVKDGSEFVVYAEPSLRIYGGKAVPKFDLDIVVDKYTFWSESVDLETFLEVQEMLEKADSLSTGAYARATAKGKKILGL